MTQNAILFMPDISGFTEFVHHTDINHSKHIIERLPNIDPIPDAIPKHKLFDETEVINIPIQ